MYPPLASRQLLCVVSPTLPNVSHQAIILGDQGIPFQQASNLLGQEFETIIFDARTSLHLEALAICAGTLKAGGLLVIVLNEWENFVEQADKDSLRWAGQNEAIKTPHFFHYLQQLIKKYQFKVIDNTAKISPFLAKLQINREYFTSYQSFCPTEDQQQIIQQILHEETDLYFLTAKRGRGKSALLGFLAQRLNQQEQKIYLTAPNKNAVQVLTHFAQVDIEFIAPDELFSRLQQSYDFTQQINNAWLFVDEAAMLPIALLTQFSQYFRHIVFATTIHSYEGTGRGFELKFKRKIHRTFSHFELIQPLRWRNDDEIEQFIDELLLLNVEDEIQPPKFSSIVKSSIQIQVISQQELVQAPQSFYALLTQAHYRTSPIDLRRLFDAPNQQFYLAQTTTHLSNNLLGALWLIQEGGMQDHHLIENIQRGNRRPKGNLVPQALCFHADLPQACMLNSIRISRIAVQTTWQQQGIGTQLIQYLQQHSETDFLSVSFSYTEELARFWQKCGFVLVQIGEHLETSSGNYAAIALYGISEQGKILVHQAEQQFQRDFPLSFHPYTEIFTTKDWALTHRDQQNLQNFAYFYRTLFSATPAIRRLLRQVGENHLPILAEYCRTQQIPNQKKMELKKMRDEVKRVIAHLDKKAYFLDKTDQTK